jgi:hypothetical protein
MKHIILLVADQPDATSAAIHPMKKGFQKPVCTKNFLLANY